MALREGVGVAVGLEAGFATISMPLIGALGYASPLAPARALSVKLAAFIPVKST